MIARARAPDTTAQNAAATRQTEIAESLLDMSREAMDRGNALVDRYQPIYDQILQGQVEMTAESRDRARQSYDRYDRVFAPLQDRVASDAMDYDSESNIAAEQGRAVSAVQGQFENVRGQAERRLAAQGVSPSSGRSVQGGVDASNTLALARAGASNSTRSTMQRDAIGLRGQAASIGTQVANQGDRQQAIASGNQTAQQGTIASTVGATQQPAQVAGQFASQAAGQYGAAGNAFGSIANSQYQQNQNDANSTNEAIGTIAALVISSKKKKKNAKPVDDADSMNALRKIPTKEWDYKEGAGDGGHHVGPMAEDVQQAAGNQAAPGGEKLDLISMNGVTMSAVKNLDTRLQRMESAMGGGEEKAPASLALRKIPRDTNDPLRI